MRKIVSSAASALSFCGCARGATPAAQTNYVLGVQDVLTVTVFGETELSRKYTVEQDGTFTFPLIGRVKAGGLTLRALEAELNKKLSGGYLKNPQSASRSRPIAASGSS